MSGQRKLRLAIVLPSFAIGGAQRMVCELVRSLDSSRIDAFVICFAGHEEHSFLEKRVEAAGVPVVYGEINGGGLCRASFVWSSLAMFHPDVVHAHLGGVQLSIPWCLTHRTPLVITLHTTMPLAMHHLAERAVRFFGRSNTFRLVAVSKETQAQAADYFGNTVPRVDMVQNGITLSDFRGHLESDDPVYINVGTQDENKNQKIIIQAFNEVNKRVPNSQLILIGDGPLHESLASMAGQSDAIEVPGATDYVPEALARANIYIQSSNREAMPMSILEAMACGMPVISTDVGGVGSLIDDGHNGFIIEAGRADQLSIAMLALCDEHKRRVMGERSLEIAKGFSAADMAKGYEAIYSEVVCL